MVKSQLALWRCEEAIVERGSPAWVIAKGAITYWESEEAKGGSYPPWSQQEPTWASGRGKRDLDELAPLINNRLGASISTTL